MARSKKTKKVNTMKKENAQEKISPSKIASEKLHARPETRLASFEQRELTEEHTREMIENKAYELYQQRGYLPGDDLSDWFTAEKLVHEELARRGVKKNRQYA